MKKVIVAVFIVFLVVTSQAPAVTLTDNFDGGLSQQLWQVFKVKQDTQGNYINTDALGAPWNVGVSSQGVLNVSKAADSDSSTNHDHLLAGVKSQFTLDGDFMTSVDYTLTTFPPTNTSGWNEIQLRIVSKETNACFMPVVFTGHGSEQFAEGYSSISPNVLNQIPDNSTSGSLFVTRTGQVVTAWIQNNNQLKNLGSINSSLLNGQVEIWIMSAQAVDWPQTRPSTALDVSFDNFSVEADSIIIPEPCTLALISLGGLLLSRRK